MVPKTTFTYLGKVEEGLWCKLSVLPPGKSLLQQRSGPGTSPTILVTESQHDITRETFFKSGKENSWLEPHLPVKLPTQGILRPGRAPKHY